MPTDSRAPRAPVIKVIALATLLIGTLDISDALHEAIMAFHHNQHNHPA